MMDGDSPLTSAGSFISTELRFRAGSETSQQSEGSSVQAKQRKVDEDDDDFKVGTEDDEEEMQPQVSVTSSTQKRKRKNSRVVLSDADDDDDEYSPVASTSRRQRSAASQSVSQDRDDRARSRQSRSSSAPKRKRSTDQATHSDSDDRAFPASLPPARQRSTSAQSSSKDREMKRLIVDGEWGEKGQTMSSWATRPKRNSASRNLDYSQITLSSFAQVHQEPTTVHAPETAQPTKPTAKSASKKKEKEAAKVPSTLQPSSEAPADGIVQPDQLPAVVPPSKPKKAAKKKPTKDPGPSVEPTVEQQIRRKVEAIAAEAGPIPSLSPAPQSPPVQEGRARRKAAAKPVSYVPQYDLDGNPLSESDTPSGGSLRPAKAKYGQIKPRLLKARKVDKDSDPSSYDSLFDANLHSEDDGAREQRKVAEQKQKKATSSARSKTKNKPLLQTRKEAEEDAGFVVFEKDGKSYLPQFQCCQRQMQFQQCRYCVARQAGDTCRFIGIRAVPVRVREDGIQILTEQATEQDGPIFIDDVTLNEDVVLPDHYDLNRPMNDDCKINIMTTTATSLVFILKEALEHAKKPDCIRRARELQIRAMCDYCSTGLFSASYLCTRCGGEFCLPCREAMKDHAMKNSSAQTQLFTCVRDKFAERQAAKGTYKASRQHTVEMMLPVSRFTIEELQEEVTAMEAVIEEHASSIPTSTMKPEAEQGDTHITQPQHIGEGIPSQPLTVESKASMDQARFLSTWSKGEPILVTEVYTQNVWDPAAFVERYGSMDCDIVRCDEHAPFMLKEKLTATLKAHPHYFHRWEKPVKVHQFFETFGMPDEERATMFGKGIWKLKDWPPAAEFSTAFPDIYEDFNYAVPMPDFTRRDGCVNISSLFPKNANGPDLGPKMYNAWPGEHSAGKKGTTCLHMDIADAVNILLYTAEREGAEQAAQWDIFRAEDANAIREFIRARHPGSEKKGDPIHAQVHYLDDDALRDLYEQKGVYSWRILQRKGQAVFIPAGCAHQVCNLTDCIKVAVDFISPQNIARCFQLTEEFRGLTLEGRKSWKEDVLQLKAQLWYAWKACRALPPPPTDEEHQQGSERRELKRQKQLRKEESRLEELERRRAATRAKRARDAKSTSSPEKETIALGTGQDAVAESQTAIFPSSELSEAPPTSQGGEMATMIDVAIKDEQPEMDTLAADAAHGAEEIQVYGQSEEGLLPDVPFAEKTLAKAVTTEEFSAMNIVAEEANAGHIAKEDAAADDTIAVRESTEAAGTANIVASEIIAEGPTSRENVRESIVVELTAGEELKAEKQPAEKIARAQTAAEESTEVESTAEQLATISTATGNPNLEGTPAKETLPVETLLKAAEESAAETTIAEEYSGEEAPAATFVASEVAAGEVIAVEPVASEVAAEVQVVGESSAEEKMAAQLVTDEHVKDEPETLSKNSDVEDTATEAILIVEAKPPAEEGPVPEEVTLDLTQASSDAADDTFQSAEGTPEPTTPDIALKPTELATLSTSYSEDGINTPSPLASAPADCAKMEFP